jgi:hypothetical protein
MVFVATTQSRVLLLTHSVVYPRLNMDKEVTGLVMAGHACRTGELRCFWTTSLLTASTHTPWGKLSPLVRSRFEAQ